MSEQSRPEQEGFGEALPGETQSSKPPEDPEMTRDETEEQNAEESAEKAAGDQDAGPTKSAEQAEEDRDQAEG